MQKDVMYRVRINAPSVTRQHVEQQDWQSDSTRWNWNWRESEPGPGDIIEYQIKEGSP